MRQFHSRTPTIHSNSVMRQFHSRTPTIHSNLSFAPTMVQTFAFFLTTVASAKVVAAIVTMSNPVNPVNPVQNFYTLNTIYTAIIFSFRVFSVFRGSNLCVLCVLCGYRHDVHLRGQSPLHNLPMPAFVRPNATQYPVPL